MSFTRANKPRIGEVARCARCAMTWLGVTCECDNELCGSRLVTAAAANIDSDIAARLVADRATLFCPRCCTDDEKFAVWLKQRAETRGEKSN